MQEPLLQLGAEFGAAAVRAIGAVCAAALGIVVELNGLQTLDANVGVVGVWMTVLGCLLLVIGYILANDAIDLVRAQRQPTN
jgi:hypothetical protein